MGIDGTVMPVGLSLRSAAKATVKLGLSFGLRIPPMRRLIEALACFCGRRAPDAWSSQALIYYVREELLRFDANRVRFAQLPGHARIAVTLTEGLWQMLYFNGRYEMETTRFVMNFLRPGDVFVDVGANVGYYTMIAASAVGSAGKIYAFEPNPQVASLLRTSVNRATAGEQVTIETAALGADNGTATLHLPEAEWNTGEASLLSYSGNERGKSLSVPITTLDQYCVVNKVARIRLMKIDVEGGELEVLAGAHDVLERIRPEAIVCEFVPARRSEAQVEVLKILQAHEYRSFIVNENGSLSPHDGSIPDWEWGNLCFMPGESGSVHARPH